EPRTGNFFAKQSAYMPAERVLNSSPFPCRNRRSGELVESLVHNLEAPISEIAEQFELGQQIFPRQLVRFDGYVLRAAGKVLQSSETEQVISLNVDLKVVGN